MTGRDMAAISVGLYEAIDIDYLQWRVDQTHYLGRRLEEAGIPVVKPFGGHAIFVDAMKFLPHIPQDEYPAQVLAVALYVEGGIRGVEIGTVLADRDPVTGKNRHSSLELLRLAIPWRVYTNNHMDVVVEALKEVWEKRNTYQGLRLTYEAPTLRHFTAEFERI